MRLSGAIFLDAEFTAPWCVTAKVGPEDCEPFAPVPKHVIAYHYVTAGTLLLKLENSPAMTVMAGEIVVLPRNDHHILGSTLNTRSVRADGLIEPNHDGGLARIVYGGGGERTQIVCGFLGSNLAHNPILAILPKVMKMNIADGASGEWIESSFRFAARELTQRHVKSPAVLAGLAEVLFIEAMRRYFASLPIGEISWAAAIGDPTIACALGLIHSETPRRWTTEQLAQESGLSRSAFAERFTRIMGEPPMRYIARQRLQQASMRLKESSDAIARIAFEIGYESEAAFNRAFKREYGMPPAEWRRTSAPKPILPDAKTAGA